MSKESSTSKQTRLCGLCDEKPSKYCCPRCEIFYCSLECYKSEKHEGCSESFYRECVNEELASHQVGDDAKAKMIDILKKMHENDDDDQIEEIENVEEIDSDDGSEIDLHTRIQDLNLDDPDALWNALTEDERNDFEAMLNQGDVGTIIPQWEPWWSFTKEKKLVEDVEESSKEMEALKKCPEIKSVPKFTSLTTVKPSPAIRFNMANVVASYAFIMRYFNGEIEPMETASYLLDICTNLNCNNNFEDPESAVESVAQRCLQSELIQTDEASLEVMRNDTLQILQGPSEENKLHYNKATFSHIIQIFADAKSLSKRNETDLNDKSTNKGTFSRKFPEHKQNHLPSIDLSKVKKVIKKLEYYLSFLDSCDNQV
nr:zinc finger HIT domain-containing protein 2 [Vanessa tameamea]